MNMGGKNRNHRFLSEVYRMELNDIELQCLQEKARENDFFKSLLEHYNEFKEVSEKQYLYIEKISRAKKDIEKNNSKLGKFVKGEE